MTCDEFKELAPAYALIALDEDERRACAQHLAAPVPHRGCAEAVEHATLVVTRLGAGLPPVLPAARVWQNIAAAVRSERPALAAAAATRASEEARRRGLYQLCGWLLAVTLLGLYLYAFPFEFGHHPPPRLGTAGLQPETALRSPAEAARRNQRAAR
jgi:hypothetical protein